MAVTASDLFSIHLQRNIDVSNYFTGDFIIFVSIEFPFIKQLVIRIQFIVMQWTIVFGE